jgi:putative heme-binding domain-containing protein
MTYHSMNRRRGPRPGRAWALRVVLGVAALAAGGAALADDPGGPAYHTNALGLRLLPGFEAEVLYDVPGETQGSWVALCTGPGGTLFATDQYGEVYRVTPPAPGSDGATQVQPLGMNLGGAQGLCYAFDALYIMATGKGLYRAADPDGDGRPDAPELILAIPGGGEHGQHAVVVAPDGASLLLSCGNHCDLPALTHSRVPRVWGEDLLLPREWDANGHAVGRLAPGGYVLRVSPDAGEVDLVSIGYRNQYDLAVDRHGEVFTFDADMEWDMGMPWYRPTRVCHVVSGSEFGWRSGTGKWPTYTPDSLPAVMDIGPGSPTGVLFGTGAAFPARYQDALYLLDWTFGTVYAVELAPDGASYTATAHEFLSGSPLPLTDAVVGADGAMYLTTGGRRLGSKLYRVTYQGDADTAPSAGPPAPTPEAELRHALEALHTPDAPAEALDTIWPALRHPDRHVRFAARTALEHQPAERWRQRALDEQDAVTATHALLALARVGSADDRPALLAAANRHEAKPLTEAQRLDLTRVYILAFCRMGAPGPAMREALLQRFEARFPHDDGRLSIELARLLVYLDSAHVVDGAVTLMNLAARPEPPAWLELIARNAQYGNAIQNMIDAMPPVQALHYAFLLRNHETGWTPELRQAYFLWLNLASRSVGGNSYGGFLDMIRTQVLATCSPEEQEAVAALLIVPDSATALGPDAAPRGPGRAWTVDGAYEAVLDRPAGYNAARGAELYQTALCAQCHRFQGVGGSAGPDLTAVGSTYGLRDLLAGIIDPSAAVTDQYAWSTVTTDEGRHIVGRVVLHDDTVLRLHTSATDPSQTLDVPAEAVREVAPYDLSPMPQGLVHPLNASELRDLTLYVMSGGDEDTAATIIASLEAERSARQAVARASANVYNPAQGMRHGIVLPVFMLAVTGGLVLLGVVTYAGSRGSKAA